MMLTGSEKYSSDKKSLVHLDAATTSVAIAKKIKQNLPTPKLWPPFLLTHEHFSFGRDVTIADKTNVFASYQELMIPLPSRHASGSFEVSKRRIR